MKLSYYIKIVALGTSLLVRSVYAQQSTLLVIVNRNANIILDGEIKGNSEANHPLKVLTTAGGHYIQAEYDDGTLWNKGQVVTLEADKQKIILLTFEENQQPQQTLSAIPVADLNFAIPGAVNVALWMKDNPNAEYPYPAYYFAFEKGDEIIIHAAMTNRNGTNTLEVATHPGNVIKYSNRSFTELNDLRIKVEERSIYRFTFATNHAFDRNCLLKIFRAPASVATVSFNSNVSKQKVYKPVEIIEPTIQTLNGGLRATFADGKSRIYLSVTPPPNTVYWFYRISAERSQQEIENVQRQFQLMGELTSLLLKSTSVGLIGSKLVDIGVEQLTRPPGSEYCDVFLLDYNNLAAFLAKDDQHWTPQPQGTREHIIAGNVKIDCCTRGEYFLGLRNPSATYPIDISLEVIAVTEQEEWRSENDQ